MSFTGENGWLVNIEIKDFSGTPGDETVVRRVAGLIDELKMTDRVLVSSFKLGYLERIKAANPSIDTGALANRPSRDPFALLRRLGAISYHPRLSAIRRGDIGLLREEGYDVLVWVVNDDKTMRALIKAGVRGIITDFPQIFELGSRGLRRNMLDPEDRWIKEFEKEYGRHAL